MVISELAESDRSAWDAYVAASPTALPQHLSAWREVLAETYAYRTHYLFAREGEQIVGVLPMFLVPRPLFTVAARTMPGGLDANSAETARALIQAGREIAGEAGASQLVLHDSRTSWPGEWETSSEYVHWLVDLWGGVDRLWKRLDGNIRRQVRIARRNGLTATLYRDGGGLEDFYIVLSRFTHQAGTPVFGRDFLQRVVAAFPDGFNILVVYREGQPIGAYFQFEMGTTVYGTWGATIREFLPLRPVYLAYWSIMEDAATRGFAHLDMGRSPTDANTSRFKGQWGGACRPIYQQVAVVEGRQRRDGTRALPSPTVSHFFTQVWSRLPFPVAQLLGPRLRRYVPFG